MKLDIEHAKQIAAMIFSKPALTQQEYEAIQKQNLLVMNLEHYGMPKAKAEQFVRDYAPDVVQAVLRMVSLGKHDETMNKLRELAGVRNDS